MVEVNKRPTQQNVEWVFLISRRLPTLPRSFRAVPSAPAGLTSVFGMGTGVTLPTKSSENFLELCTLIFVHLAREFHEQSTKIEAQSSKIE